MTYRKMIIEDRKKHINKIAKTFECENSKFLEKVSIWTNCVIKTGLDGSNKFLYEILQNAEDSSIGDDHSIAIEFIQKDSHLIIRYNGKGFDFDDVERICDYASNIEMKNNDPNKIGYKGFGFKTLFNISDCVTIVSNDYSFRFDKNYGGGNKLWQVVPIWCNQNDIPLGVRVCTKTVNIILKLKNKAEVASKLQHLLDNPEILLFLNHVNKLTINLKIIEKRTKNYLNFSNIEFYISNERKSCWLLNTYEEDINKKIKDVLNDDEEDVYPERLKNASKIKLTFAVKIKNGSKRIRTLSGFCYTSLPTEVTFNLPYHINGPFILNLDRTQLAENEWNNYLINCFGALQLSFLKDLASDHYLKKYVVLLFEKNISHNNRQFEIEFEKGLRKAKEKIWIPAYVSDSVMLNLKELWVDSIGFFKKFPDIKDKKRCRLIHYDVKSSDKLCKYGFAKNFDFTVLFRNLRSYSKSSDQFYTQFLDYLEKSSNDFPELQSKLPTKKFLLTKANEFCAPKCASLESDLYSTPSFLNINAINKDLLPKTKVFKNWLISLGVKDLSPIEIVTENIIPCISECNTNIENHKDAIHYLTQTFDLYWTSLNVSEITKMKQLLVLTKSEQMRFANECYWPEGNSSVKEFIAKGMLRDDDLVSADYKKESRRLLLELGVHGELTFKTLYTKYLEGLHLNDRYYADEFWNNLSMYFKQCENERQSDLLLKTVADYLKVNKCLRGNNQKLYCSTDLYSTLFMEISSIDRETFPVLNGEYKLPNHLEMILGFKSELETDKIRKLLINIRKHPEKATTTVFKIILEQLKASNCSLVGKRKVFLWAENNTLQPADSLYYFREEMADFPKKSPAYLKRLPDFSHDEILTLGELCGVNIIDYFIELSAKNLEPDRTFTEFFFNLLPLIALAEAYCRSKTPECILQDIYRKFRDIQHVQCSELYVKYCFQKETSKISYFFEAEKLKFYTLNSWEKPNCKIKVIDQVAKLLQLKTDCREILEIKSEEDIKTWVDESGFDFKNYQFLKKKLKEITRENPLTETKPQVKIKKEIKLRNSTPTSDVAGDKEINCKVETGAFQEDSSFFGSESQMDIKQSITYDKTVEVKTLPNETKVCNESRNTRNIPRIKEERICENGIHTVQDENLLFETERQTDIKRLINRNVAIKALPDEREVCNGSINSTPNIPVIKEAKILEYKTQEFENESSLFTSKSQFENAERITRGKNVEVKFMSNEDKICSEANYIPNVTGIKQEKTCEDETKKNGLDVSKRSSDKNIPIANTEQCKNSNTDEKNSNFISSISGDEKNNIRLIQMVDIAADLEQYEPKKVKKFQRKPKDSVTPEKHFASERNATENVHNQPQSSAENVSPQYNKIAAGRRGEELVFQKIKENYRQRYPSANIEEKGRSFILTNADGTEVKIKWLNKYTEAHEPWDLLIHENGEVAVIEVKSTILKDNNEFILTQKEFQVMQEYKEKYHIYRVFQVNSQNLQNIRILILKNPSRLLENGILTSEERMEYSVKIPNIYK